MARFTVSTIGKALLREDRNFHSDNDAEDNSTTRALLLVAAARYLAAHSPTMRSQGHAYQTANKLYYGEHLFEE